MKKLKILSLVCALLLTLPLSSCHPVRKQITVVIREAGSGTREGFDLSVTNGVHFLQERDESGKKIYRSARDAVVQTKSGAVLSSVAYDRNAIGYLSVSSVSDLVKVVSVNGILPTDEAVASRAYPITRPYVIMTTRARPLSPLAADFLHFLKSEHGRTYAAEAGCVFLADPSARANPDAAPIPIVDYEPQSVLPAGKLLIRGSTSLERLITSAARAYAALYGGNASELFDLQLEGSSIGQKSVENDLSGNVIGLSSVAVNADGIESFNLCLDAIAVVVHPENTVSDLTLDELYAIFSGEIRHFDELGAEGDK